MGASLNAEAAKAGLRGPLRDATSCQPPITSASRPASDRIAGIEGAPEVGGMEAASCSAPEQLMPPPNGTSRRAACAGGGA